jgi:hypothetical protein
VPYGWVTVYDAPGLTPRSRTRTRPKVACSPAIADSPPKAASWAETKSARTPPCWMLASAEYQKVSGSAARLLLAGSSSTQGRAPGFWGAARHRPGDVSGRSRQNSNLSPVSSAYQNG